MTTRPARRSLAESFRPAAATPDRSATLGGLLPPRTADGEGPPAADPPGGALAIVKTRAPGRSTGRVGGGGTAAAAGSSPGSRVAADAAVDAVRNVAVYLPQPLLQRFRRTTRSRELTYAELLVEAAAAHLDDVATTFTTRVAAAPAGPGMPVRVRRRHPEPGVQVQIRLDGHQVTWLDEQAERLGAPSRTALVAALLRAHLGADQ